MAPMPRSAKRRQDAGLRVRARLRAEPHQVLVEMGVSSVIGNLRFGRISSLRLLFFVCPRSGYSPGFDFSSYNSQLSPTSSSLCCPSGPLALCCLSGRSCLTICDLPTIYKAGLTSTTLLLPRFSPPGAVKLSALGAGCTSFTHLSAHHHTTSASPPSQVRKTASSCHRATWNPSTWYLSLL